MTKIWENADAELREFERLQLIDGHLRTAARHHERGNDAKRAEHLLSASTLAGPTVHFGRWSATQIDKRNALMRIKSGAVR